MLMCKMKFQKYASSLQENCIVEPAFGLAKKQQGPRGKRRGGRRRWGQGGEARRGGEGYDMSPEPHLGG